MYNDMMNEVNFIGFWNSVTLSRRHDRKQVRPSRLATKSETWSLYQKSSDFP